MTAVMRWEYEAESKEVRAFLKLHRDHPGVRTATAWLDSLLRRAGLGDTSVMGFEHWRRLSAAGVTGADCLQELCALALHERRNHFTRYPSDRAYTFQMVRSLWRLAPYGTTTVYRHGELRKRYQRADGTEKEEVGQMLREGIGVFLRHVAGAIEERRAATPQQVVAMRTPFNTEESHKE